MRKENYTKITNTQNIFHGLNRLEWQIICNVVMLFVKIRFSEPQDQWKWWEGKGVAIAQCPHFRSHKMSSLGPRLEGL